jgi:hypothetical protein
MSRNYRLNWFNLQFCDPEVENQYRKNQLPLVKKRFEGKWGVYSIIHSACLVTIIQVVPKAVRRSPGSVERLICTLPVMFFCSGRQIWAYRRRFKYPLNFNWSIVSLTLLFFLFLLEVSAAYINDLYREYEGCPAHRFRCPFSFNSALFTYRVVFLMATFIMHNSPCLPFHLVALIAITFLGLNRFFGHLLVGGEVTITLWSMICQLACTCVFLANRYRTELGERRIFLLHSGISDTKANADELERVISVCIY